MRLPCSAYDPDLPGCIAVGDTLEEVEQSMKEAIQFHLEGLQQEDLPLSESTSVSRMLKVWITPHRSDHTFSTQNKLEIALLRIGDKIRPGKIRMIGSSEAHNFHATLSRWSRATHATILPLFIGKRPPSLCRDCSAQTLKTTEHRLQSDCEYW